MPASALRRWWLRRTHGSGPWGALLQAAAAGDWVSLDLETTGLDPRSDHILSLAAVPIRDGQVRLSERFERLVRPRREFGIESIRHHLITPDEAAAGVPVEDAVRDFLHWLGSRTLRCGAVICKVACRKLGAIAAARTCRRLPARTAACNLSGPSPPDRHGG